MAVLKKNPEVMIQMSNSMQGLNGTGGGLP